ncbi:MAG: uncharacterized protein KVP18_002255 [Porospora cf. gigantea A]|uniref:uncharacterized protein n=1 Tax=Porospora cf. gigantea A TaxID=2853593 RepID=UPI003559E65D|nr:MAG: hypothetical protein KVP18_002255 [Porospora cf. gigantea A]
MMLIEVLRRVVRAALCVLGWVLCLAGVAVVSAKTRRLQIDHTCTDASASWWKQGSIWGPSWELCAYYGLTALFAHVACLLTGMLLYYDWPLLNGILRVLLAVTTLTTAMLVRKVVCRMVVWAITGGIGTGKTSVSNKLRAEGAIIIDADEVAREVVLPGEKAYKRLVEAFGPTILKSPTEPDSLIDRKHLRRVAFADPESVAKLNRITHEAILKRMLRLLWDVKGLWGTDKDALVVFDIPLLFETKVFKWVCAPIVVVSSSPEKQLERVLARASVPPMTKDFVEKAMASQIPLSVKGAQAHIVLDNNGTLEATWQQLKEFASVKFGLYFAAQEDRVLTGPPGTSDSNVRRRFQKPT